MIAPDLDIHRDSPVESLHTWLLGGEKYVWHKTHTDWKEKQERIFAVRIEASSVDGLNMYPIRGTYMVKYKNGLVGKHFRALQQAGIFHLYGELESKTHLELWRTAGELGALMYYGSIENIDEYIVSKSRESIQSY